MGGRMLLRGVFFLMSAELCFALTTVFAKFVNSISSIPAVEITFFRFFFGVFLALAYMLKSKTSFVPNRWDLVFWRGLFNTLAVIFLFMSVERTTLTNANMLNLTYPAFLFLVAPFINGEKRFSLMMFGFLALTMTGISLIIHPDFHRVRMGDVYGLLSGIMGAFGVATLRKAREHDSSAIILLYLMATGLVINFAVMEPVFVMPHGKAALYVAISALLGVLGQALLTYGYIYISAMGGGLVSSSRIVFATLLGMLCFNEALTVRIAIGGGCIATSIIGVALWMRAPEKMESAEVVQPAGK